MKKLDFEVHKTKEKFRDNYKLHDLAETHGKNLLIQWGMEFEEFGKDKRHEKVWESGKDKPDLIIYYKGKKALLEWKGKRNSKWIINERAAKAYGEWGKRLTLTTFICFAVFDEEYNLKSFRFAVLGFHPYKNCTKREWDKNKTVEFAGELPCFTKANFLKFLNGNLTGVPGI
jgi:hypothetical protein